MSFLDRIAECNAHDLSGFLPFEVAGRRVGWVRPAFARRLAAYEGAFETAPDRAALAPRFADPEARTEALAAVVRDLSARGALGPLRGEDYAVAAGFGAETLARIDRCAVAAFGIRACGVHVNGFVRAGGTLSMWIGRRARDKATFPGMLDNLVAGGQPAGLGLMENVVKEAGEEAGIPEALARQARPVGVVTYRQETEEGFKPDAMFCYDLELPAGFVPKNADGELEEFYLWPVERVMETVAETREFKFNCNLVCIDFFARHGLLDPERPDFVEIVARLRS